MSTSRASTIQVVAPYPCNADNPPVEDGMLAINANGEAVVASDTAGLTVLGVCKGIRRDYPDPTGYALPESLLHVMNNDAEAPVTRNHRAKPCYVKDAFTVTATKPANGTVAGLVIDVDAEGVIVDFSPAAIAAAAILAAQAETPTP